MDLWGYSLNLEREGAFWEKNQGGSDLIAECLARHGGFVNLEVRFGAWIPLFLVSLGEKDRGDRDFLS